MSEIIKVGLGARSYDIHVGRGLLAQAPELLKPFARGPVPVVTAPSSIAVVPTPEPVPAIMAVLVPVTLSPTAPVPGCPVKLLFRLLRLSTS